MLFRHRSGFGLTVVVAQGCGSAFAVGIGMADEETKWCESCQQYEGDEDKHAPEGYTKHVYFTKGGSECGACINCRRGSFANQSLHDLLRKRKAHVAVDDKFSECREASVHAISVNPKKKHKYEKADMELLTAKEEEDYLDCWQDYTWKTLKNICDEKCQGNKFKSDVQRKKYVQDTLGMELTKNKDGVLGVAVVVGNPDEMKMRKGKKVAVKKIKNYGHEDKEEQAEKVGKLAAGLVVPCLKKRVVIIIIIISVW